MFSPKGRLEDWAPLRFPPLNEELKTWSDAQILAKIGNSEFYDPGGLVNKLVIAECARRGFNADRISEILLNVAHGEYERRLDEVKAGFRHAEQLPPWEQMFSKLLRAYQQAGDSIAANLLFTVTASQCPASVEKEAIAALRSEVAASGAVRYLGRCGTSIETLPLIDGAKAPEDLRRLAKDSLTRRVARNW